MIEIIFPLDKEILRKLYCFNVTLSTFECTQYFTQDQTES